MKWQTSQRSNGYIPKRSQALKLFKHHGHGMRYVYHSDKFTKIILFSTNQLRHPLEKTHQSVRTLGPYSYISAIDSEITEIFQIFSLWESVAFISSLFMLSMKSQHLRLPSRLTTVSQVGYRASRFKNIFVSC